MSDSQHSLAEGGQVNRFPSCNEEEIMVMGSVYSRRAA